MVGIPRHSVARREQSKAIPDSAAIERLRRLGAASGRDVLGEVIASYRVDGPERMAEIRRALEESDAEALRRAAHALGGVALVLGASLLAGLCTEAQRRAHEGDLAGCRQHLAALQAAHEDLLSALETIASKAAGARSPGRAP